MNAEKKFMRAAIKEARKALAKGDYGIGAVIVKDGKIIARAGETLKTIHDPINGHAEIGAIRKACKKIKSGYLQDCILYSTHEPCPMCTTATYWAKIKGIVYGISRQDMIEHMKTKGNEKFSWRQIDISCEDLLNKSIPNLNIEIEKGFLREECLKLLDETGAIK
jgi:tRNA(Arg) A34 adenosine deaminase TadA